MLEESNLNMGSCPVNRGVIVILICDCTVGGTSTSCGQFSDLCPKKPEGVRRSFDLYCPIRKNYELVQKNETECFQVLNMASPLRPYAYFQTCFGIISEMFGCIYALLLNNG